MAEIDQLTRSRSEIIAAVAESLRQMTEIPTNIQIVLSRTDISEQEVIKEFGSMDGLILALVSQLMDALSLPLQGPAQDEKEFRQRLLQFGQSLAEAYSFSALSRLTRIAITESIRHTGLGGQFYEAGPHLLTQRLASFLEGGQQAGAIAPVDSQLAADHFLSLVRADLDLIDSSSHGSPTRARMAAEQAVSLFHGGILGRKE